MIACLLMLGSPAYEELDFEHVDLPNVAVSERGVRVFLNRDSLEDFISKRTRVLDGFTLPDIDFERYMVVGVFLGRKPTGGYSLEVDRVILKGDELLVEVKEICPNKGQPVLMVITYPYSFILVERRKFKQAKLVVEECR